MLEQMRDHGVEIDAAAMDKAALVPTTRRGTEDIFNW